MPHLLHIGFRPEPPTAEFGSQFMSVPGSLSYRFSGNRVAKWTENPDLGLNFGSEPISSASLLGARAVWKRVGAGRSRIL